MEASHSQIAQEVLATNSESVTTSLPARYEHVQDITDSGSSPNIVSQSEDLEVVCGPLLNYSWMSEDNQPNPTWHGSVLIVTKPRQRQPQLRLRSDGPSSQLREIPEGDGTVSPDNWTSVNGVTLFADSEKTFWRFSLSIPLQADEVRWEYQIPRFRYASSRPSRRTWSFVVPSAQQSMRVMFHSCNGFSLGTDLDHWKGPVLWNDVLRVHEQRPFHVMIGGGDQIYSDGVRVDDGPLKTWTDISNPHKRRAHPFPNEMRVACDNYYFANYLNWYVAEPFASANSQIPQINIWDDHDIIDGFGSYTDHFMKCPVFRGIGGVAFKYYCLFQHHSAPPQSTFTTDAPETMKAVNGTSGPDPRQLANSYVLEERENNPSWIVGTKPGPYVEERSRNLYIRLGRRMAFVGIDARTERTRHQINYPETYEAIFARVDKELSAAKREIKHLLLLLGVPIAYPRLAWLENIFRSPVIAPIRLLNKRFGLGGEFFNKFDGQVDLLDDLDDHYTARQHKHERRQLIQSLQVLSRKHSVRVTILGGDVHLAAVGRFFSDLKLNIPPDKDFRYMANVISSAITNKPPPRAVANLLARRNKIHHLDHDTDETLMKLFDQQPGGKEKGAAFNKVTMPSRNYACITEVEQSAVPATDVVDALVPTSRPKNGRDPLHRGEEGAGTMYRSAEGGVSGLVDALDISIRVEIDPSDTEGRTQGYGFSVPPLDLPPEGGGDDGSEHRFRFHLHRHHQHHLRHDD